MEKDNAIQTIIEEVFSRYTDGSYIKASMLPFFYPKRGA